MSDTPERILYFRKDFEAVSDCFKFMRLEQEFNSLSWPAHFNEKPRERMRELDKEMNEICTKYWILI